MSKYLSLKFLFVIPFLTILFFFLPMQQRAPSVTATEIDVTFPFQEERNVPSTSMASNFGEIHNIQFKRLGDAEGLPHSVVNDIIQDQQGFIWIGTADGLARFDGESFKVYQNDPADPKSLSSNTILSLYEARDGRLWIGTRSGINVLDKELGRITQYLHDPGDENSLSHNQISTQAFYEDEAGNMWVATWGGLNKFDPETAVFTRFQHDPINPNSLINNTIQVIYPDSGGLWLGTNNGLDYFDFATEQFIHYQHDDAKAGSLSNNQIQALYVNPDESKLWVGTRNGLDMLELVKGSSVLSGNGHFTHYIHDQQIEQSLGANEILTITGEDSGQLWIGLSNGGLDYFDPITESFRHIQFVLGDSSTLSNNTVTALLLDQNGGLWAGTRGGGINYFHPSAHKFELYQNNPYDLESLSYNAVPGIYIDRQNELWIASLGGGVNHFDVTLHAFRRYVHDPDNRNSLSSNNTFSIFEDSRTDLWIATLGGGVNRYNRQTDTFTRFRHNPNDPHSLSHNSTRWITEDNEGQLWIATVAGGISIFDPKTEHFTHFKHNPKDPTSLCNNQVWSILQDSENVIWVTTAGCLHKFNPETQTFQRYQHQPNNPIGLVSDTPIRLFEDSQNRFWITSNQGLNLFNRSTEIFKNYNVKNGLPDNRVTSIVEDDEGYLWLGTSHGLSRFHPQTETFRNYDTFDGLQGNLFSYPGAAKSSDGTLYFGGSNGLNVFHPDQLAENLIPPQTILTNFQLSNKSVPIGEGSSLTKDISYLDELTLDYNQSDIRFEITVLNYAAPEKSQISYILEGFDPEWIESNEQKLTLRYTNLDPGRYILRFKGANNDGVWNEKETKLTLIITPPWWEGWLFRVGVLFITIASLWSIYHGRIYSIEMANLKLEQMVADRTVQLVEQQQLVAGIEERRRLARNLHDSMSQSLHSLALTAKTSKYLLDKKKYEELSDSLSLLSDSARQSYSEMRLILYELQITPDEQTDLLNVLYTRLELVQQNMGIVIKYEVEGLDYISKIYEIQIFYILSELINNTLKHANPAQINVSIKANDAMIIAIVEDNGQGFTKPYEGLLTENQISHFGMGLPNIIERVDELGATIKLKTTPQVGTITTISIPLKN